MLEEARASSDEVKAAPVPSMIATLVLGRKPGNIVDLDGETMFFSYDSH
jgi:hypothetical protein